MLGTLDGTLGERLKGNSSFLIGCAGSLLLHGFFSSCCKWGYSLDVGHKLLTALSSLVESGL